MALTQFGREPSSKARRQAGYIQARAAVTTAESITVPAGANIMIIQGTLPFFMSIGGTAAVPADTNDGTATSELINPSTPDESRTYNVTGASAVSVAAPNSCSIQALFFTL